MNFCIYNDNYIKCECSFDCNRKPFEPLSLESGKENVILPDGPVILAIHKGSCQIKLGKKISTEKEGSYLLLPSVTFAISIIGEAEIYLLDKNFVFKVIEYSGTLEVDDCHTHPKKPVITRWELPNFTAGLSWDKLGCIIYSNLKLKEFTHLLRCSYNNNELKEVFSRILYKDFAFRFFIMNNWNKDLTSEDMAGLLGLSLSGFQKKFRRCFDISYYQWMQEQRLKLLRHDLIFTNKSIKELTEKYHFYSPQHLGYCFQRYTGVPPATYRRAAKSGKNDKQ